MTRIVNKLLTITMCMVTVEATFTCEWVWGEALHPFSTGSLSKWQTDNKETCGTWCGNSNVVDVPYGCEYDGTWCHSVHGPITGQQTPPQTWSQWSCLRPQPAEDCGCSCYYCGAKGNYGAGTPCYSGLFCRGDGETCGFGGATCTAQISNQNGGCGYTACDKKPQVPAVSSLCEADLSDDCHEDDCHGDLEVWSRVNCQTTCQSTLGCSPKTACTNANNCHSRAANDNDVTGFVEDHNCNCGTCTNGWRGSLCNDDVNECDEANPPCHAEATCTNVPGDYTCQCNAGYEGSGQSCTMCNSQYYGSDGTCTKCGKGFVTDAVVSPYKGATTCTACVPGKWNVYSNTPCKVCDAGSGTETGLDPGAWTCIVCSAGKYSLDYSCATCPFGSVTNTGSSGGASSCTACDAGEYSERPTHPCVSCDAGSATNTGSNAGASSCTACPAGEYNVGNIEAQFTCPWACLGHIGAHNKVRSKNCEEDVKRLNQLLNTQFRCGSEGASTRGEWKVCQRDSYIQVPVKADLAVLSQATGINFISKWFYDQHELLLDEPLCQFGQTDQADGDIFEGINKFLPYSCVSCGAGSVTNTGSNAGASSCTACSPGEYSGDPTKACKACPAGKWQDTEGTTFCEPCDAGQFQDYARQSSCATCSVGSVTNTLLGTGASSCTACSPGEYSGDATQSCSLCLAGSVTNTGLQPGASTCTPCPAGRYESDGTCKDCGAGEYQPQSGSSACIKCDPGEFSEFVGADHNTCKHCGAGEYQPQSGSSACIKCDPGQFSESVRADYNTCEDCGAGEYQTESGSFECIKCDPGKFSTVEGASENTCTNCEPGKFSTEHGSTKCDCCPAGEFQTFSGKTVCVQCKGASTQGNQAPGNYSRDECASTEDTCVECKPGWFAPQDGSAACTDIDECDEFHLKVQHTATPAENCHEHALCNNTVGSYACNCKFGYSGDGEEAGTGCWGNWGVNNWNDGANKFVTLQVPDVQSLGASVCTTQGYSTVSQAECTHDAKRAAGCHIQWMSMSKACQCLDAGMTPAFHQKDGSVSDEQDRGGNKSIILQICKVGTERKSSWKTLATYADNMLHFYKQSQNALTRMTDKMQITDSLWHKICEDAKKEAKDAIANFHQAIIFYGNSVTNFNKAMNTMKEDQKTMKSNEIKMNEAIQTWMGAQSARAYAHRRHFEFHTLLGLKFPRRENSWRPAKDFMKKKHNIGPRVWDGTRYVIPNNAHTHDIYRAYKNYEDGDGPKKQARDPEKVDIKEWWHSA